MKILVTGGAGFIGSNFIKYYLQKYPQAEIICLDLLTYCGNLENLTDFKNDPRFSFVHGDINNRELVSAIMPMVSAVVHFAAETHVDRSVNDSSPFIKTNVLGTQVLLDSAKQFGVRFHYISTDEVFGSLTMEDQPANEQTVYAPRSPYSASKAAGDHLVRSYFHTHKLPITISNCSNNYGPGQFPEKFIPLMITNLLQNKNVPIYGQGQNIRDWLYVQDHCEAIDLILNNGVIGETYLIGGGNQFNNLQITKMVLNIMGQGEEKIEFVADRPGHDWRYDLSWNKINQKLGWQPKVNLLEGLAKTIQWYSDNQGWWKKLLTK